LPSAVGVQLESVFSTVVKMFDENWILRVLGGEW